VFVVGCYAPGSGFDYDEDCAGPEWLVSSLSALVDLYFVHSYYFQLMVI